MLPAVRTFLTTKEAAERVRLSESALEKKRVDGTGPIFVKLGKSVRYEATALDEWIAAGRHKSTAELIISKAS